MTRTGRLPAALLSAAVVGGLVASGSLWRPITERGVENGGA